MKKIDFETIQDYLVGGMVLILTLIPEVLKLLTSAFYIFLLWFVVISRDLGNIETDIGKIGVMLVVLITPIGAYYFYSKTIFSEVLPKIIEWLSQYTSLTTSEVRK